MIFPRIFIEKNLENHPAVLKILQKLPGREIRYIDSYTDVFGKVYKPFSHRKKNIDLFLAQKKGSLVREAPPAYGISGAPHYYFIHTYNCVFECQYCYLQGYFHSPDMVVFVNHEEILEEMQNTLAQHSGDVWFHAGEFSDSLALSHILDDWPVFWDFFRGNPRARLELRTKSANIRALKQLEPLPNVTVSFSLSAERTAAQFEKKSSPVRARLRAMGILSRLGFRIGIHLDPIIYTPSVLQDYEWLAERMREEAGINSIDYISIGAIRFNSDLAHKIEKNYPGTRLLLTDYVRSVDGKLRYARPKRMFLLQSVEEILLRSGFPSHRIYICMESDDLVYSEKE